MKNQKFKALDLRLYRGVYQDQGLNGLIPLRSEFMFCLLKNLQNLSIDCKLLENMDSNSSKALWNLKHLKLKFVNISTFFQYLTKNCGMESLKLDVVEDVSWDNNMAMLTNKFQFLPNLKLFHFFTLKIFNFKQDILLQAIFEHLLNLQELSLSDVPHVRDEVSLFFFFCS